MVTLNDIAAKAGVSQMTVSYVLSGKYKANRPAALKRAERIREIANDLGYRPNQAARAVRKGRYDAVAFLVRHYQTFMPPDLLHGIHQKLCEAGQNMMYVEQPADTFSSGQNAHDLLRELAVDGVLIDYAPDDLAKTTDHLNAFQIPAVFINRKLPVNAVYPDEHQGGFDLTEALIRLGHTRIAYAHASIGLEDHYSVVDRKSGYLEAMEANDLEPAVWSLELKDSHLSNAVPFFKEKLTASDAPTAVICYERRTANPMAFACESLCLKIDEEIILTAFSAVEYANTPFRLHVHRIPVRKVGMTAVDMLLQGIQSPIDPTPAVAIPYTMDSLRLTQ